MSLVARDWQDFKVNFKNESSSVFHTYYSKWLESFIVDDMEDLESGFSYGSLVSNPISKWCARVEASLCEQETSNKLWNEMLLQIRSALPAKATFITRDIINKLDINVNKSKVLGPVFFLPPLPWSADIAFSLLVIHTSLMPKDCDIGSIESRVFLSFIRNRARLLQIQSYLIKNLYCQLNKLADDSDSCLKQKNKYKVVILNLIFPCMSGWHGSFFGNDFLNYLQRRFLLTEPGSQKVIDGTNIFGSRLESAFIKYLFSLKNSPDFDKAQVRQSNEAFQAFYDSYKLMRAQEKDSLSSGFANKIKQRSLDFDL